MTYQIDPDVRRIAKRYNLDPKLVQAVVLAEGGNTAIIRAIQCSYPNVTTLDDALDITCRSAVHALADFGRQHAAEFTTFWGNRWAPIGAENDPRNLNRHWPGNVLRGWIGVFPGTVIAKTTDTGSDVPGGGAT